MDRNKIDAKYKWNLSELYNSDDEYKKDIDKVNRIIDEVVSYKGKVLTSSNNLYNLLELDSKWNRIFEKAYIYVSLNSCLDTRDGKWSSKENDIMDIYSEISVKTSFISIELSKLDDELLQKFINECPDLKKYEFGLKKFIKHKKHILSLEEEELLSKLGPVIDCGSSIFDKLDDADIHFDDIVDSNNNKLPLTSGLYSEYIRSSDRNIRREACYKMHEYYKMHSNTFGECLSSHIKSDCVYSKIRKFNSPLEASLSDDNLTVHFYDKVIEDTHKNISTLHRMMSVYKKALNLDEMHIYDINAAIGDVPLKKYSIEEMNEIIINALGIMGNEYVDIVKKAFNDNWVDYYETKGKRSGAFSSGCYDTKPYILMNYTGSFNDIETLAHELGHSMHSYYSRLNRGPEDASYPIFLAEIASTTHEILLNDYLLKTTKDKEMRKYILSNIISNYKSTVFRQIEFAEFEKIVHDRCMNGENLTKDDLVNIYYDLEKFYYGDNVVIDDIIKYECLRIPHFYNSFYVYKYGTSMCLAYRFATDIINKKKDAVSNYLKFIKSGGKDYPLDILKEVGIDLEKEDLMGYSLDIINHYIDELSSLL
jgi:oligoendopeptidase F